MNAGPVQNGDETLLRNKVLEQSPINACSPCQGTLGTVPLVATPHIGGVVHLREGLNLFNTVWVVQYSSTWGGTSGFAYNRCQRIVWLNGAAHRMLVIWEGHISLLL